MEFCIIISVFGMMNVGWVKYYFYNSMDKKWNIILIVGYCFLNILGGKFCVGVEEFRFFGDFKLVNVDVEIMDFFFVYVD